MLYSTDGKHAQVIQAQVKKDPSNRSNKRFFFSGIDSDLEIRAATLWLDNKAYREVFFNDLGELSYIKGTIIDKTDYHKISISPEEKALALHRYKENTIRYENAINKTQATMLMLQFILILIITLGTIYGAISYANASKNFVQMAQDNNANNLVSKEIVKSNAETTEQLAAIAAALTGDMNLTRRIS